MDSIFDNGQVVVLILFVVISGIQWLIKKIQGQGNEHEISESIEEVYDEFREEIQRRQTTIQQPDQAPSPPPLPNAHIPPLHEVATPVPSQQPPLQLRAKKPELTAAQKAAAERFQNLGKKKRNSGHATGQISARALLSNPESARQAMILHEFFGKPKSIQEV